jgi:two-component system, NtrC family, response regulator HydG
MNPKLIAVAGPLEKKEFALADQDLLIGRDAEAPIRLNDPAVSRRHCLIRRQEGHYIVQDLGSHNGTYVNGVAVKEHVLKHGDKVAVSHAVLVYSADGSEVLLRPEVLETAEVQALEFSAVAQAETLLLHPERMLTQVRPKDQGRQLKAILEVNRKAAELRRPELLQQALLEAAFELTPAESAAVLLYEQPDGTAWAALGQHRSAAASSNVQVSRTIVRRVLAERVAVLARDVASDQALKNLQSVAALGTRSILCVPLLSRQRCLGVLYLDVRSPGLVFDQVHLETLTGVAGVIGLALENALDFQRMQAQAEMLRADLEQERSIVGDSPALRKVRETMAKVAASDTTVLILGESGTGKELAARAVHCNSDRAENPFVAVNCATLGDNLLESELFGHEKGAFTGAVAAKKGLLETAEGGTVFLDEVAELPLTVQAKLLRVLQEREFTRLGSTRPIRVNMRLIAATNKDLRVAVAAGSFREDLWHRLNVISLRLPPLRERTEDIGLLAEYFLAKASKRCRRRVLGFAPEAKLALQQYDWPGNVRELENAIERAVVLGNQPEVQLDDLPETIWETAQVTSSPVTYHAALRQAKQKIVMQALDLAGGNYTEAARRLGVHVTYLHRLMRSFNLKPKGN